MKVNNRAVCVDLDGVLAKYDGWQGLHHIGEPYPQARGFMQVLKGHNLHLIVHTTRCCVGLQEESEGTLVRYVQAWLESHDIPYDEIWTGKGKPYAVAYVDDRAVACRPERDPLNDYGTVVERCLVLAEMAEE